MQKPYMDYSLLFKALSDTNRLMIIDLLSCGELCACVILEKFNITQPTLSHHMKTLCDCGLVSARKEGKWTFYSLNIETVQKVKEFLVEITSAKQDCLCLGDTCKAACE